ncbi:Glycosyltransferase [Psidium guajava]|nr:Glycosyltransferase [Psidium guajava]
MLITINFGLGSLLSFYGCHEHHNRAAGEKVDNVEVDSEQRTYAASEPRDNSNTISTAKSSLQQNAHKRANIWGYLFQIMFRMNAGAVELMDCVFWFIIVPFLALKQL